MNRKNKMQIKLDLENKAKIAVKKHKQQMHLLDSRMLRKH